MKRIVVVVAICILITLTTYLGYILYTPEISTPFDEEGEFLFLGQPFVELYSSIANVVWSSYNKALNSKPYDPGLFAWGLHYEIRSYVDLYKLTNDIRWLYRAINRCEYLYSVRDVNNDGIPSWGNYNETYGNSRYAREGYREFGVWDGVISTAFMDVVQTILFTDVLKKNATLRARAEKYLEVVITIINRYHAYWTRVSHDEGYYWDCPSGDVVGPIVNRFSALGIAEIKLYEVTGNSTYLSRPLAMATFLKKRLSIRGGCYLWTYRLSYGMFPPSDYEDISHGAIDLEFMLLAFKHKLAFSEEDVRRLVCTYKKFIWKGFTSYPSLATKVDGSITQDYTRMSRNWVLLANFDPIIWVYQWYALERAGVGYTGYYMQALSQLALYYPGPEAIVNTLIKEVKLNLNITMDPISAYIVKTTLQRAIETQRNRDYITAFKLAVKCLMIIEKSSKLAPILYVTILPVILITVILYLSRYSKSS